MTTNVWKLNTYQTVQLKHINGNTCVIKPIYGTNSFSVDMYAKGKRLPFYGTQRAYASKVLEYVNALGYK